MSDSPSKPLVNDALRRYLAYAKPYRWPIAGVIISGVAKFTLPLIPAGIAGAITTNILANKAGLTPEQCTAMLWKYGIILLAVALLEAVAIYIRGTTTQRISACMAFDVRQDLWKHIQRLSLSFHRSRPTGSILSRLMSDISVSQQMINGGIVNVGIDLGASIVAMSILLYINWKLALLVLAILPLYAMLYRRINPRIRQVSEDVQEQTAIMSGTAVERLAGIAVVQSFAQERSEERSFAEQGDELRELNIKRGKLNQTLQSISELLVLLGAASVWIYGAYLVIQSNAMVATGAWAPTDARVMSPGDVIWFTGTMGALYTPMRRFSEINIIYQTSMNAIERIFAIFDIVPAVQEKPNAPDRTPGLGGIEFDKVEFRYNPDSPLVLKGMSFAIAPGERVAIVGESGAGKSTLVTLIPRLYDVTGGAIRIDGLDLRDYPLRKLRRSIGMVLQETILFSGTVSENLRYGRKKATDEEIVAAAKAANAHQFIMAMPAGYDTVIGERGLSLSGGQRQRISLARTLLHNPRILILDEATSALDSESENLITEALERVMVGRTCLVIAHRLSTVINADRILVFRDGRLVEHGPHEELLARGGAYRFLFEQQFGPLEDLISQVRKPVNRV